MPARCSPLAVTTGSPPSFWARPSGTSSPGTFGRVAGIYNRFQYVDEMRDALNTWEAHVLGLVQA